MAMYFFPVIILICVLIFGLSQLMPNIDPFHGMLAESIRKRLPNGIGPFSPEQLERGLRVFITVASTIGLIYVSMQAVALPKKVADPGPPGPDGSATVVVRGTRAPVTATTWIPSPAGSASVPPGATPEPSRPGGFSILGFIGSVIGHSSAQAVQVLPFGSPPTFTPAPTATLYPTFTPLPTNTLLPTQAPYPTFTLPPWPIDQTPFPVRPTATRAVTAPPEPTATLVPVPQPTKTRRVIVVTATPAEESTSPPTYTPPPTYTDRPTYTPYPTEVPPTPRPTYTDRPTYTPWPTPGVATLTATPAPTPSATPLRPDVPTATPPPTAPPQDTYTPQATYTPLPTYTPWPPHLRPLVCPQIVKKVPADVIETALRNPETVYGWGMLANPGTQYSELHNPYRRRLSLRNVGLAYNQLANGVIWKAGCP